jgi:tetratricopeptide (TPR) repeat protein
MKEFKVNKFINLKLEEGKSNIYIAGKLFNLCKNLKIKNLKYEESNISSEVEFWGYCSVLQAWAENNYSLELLDKHFALTLLRQLRNAGDFKALKLLKKLTRCVYCDFELSRHDVYCPNCKKFIFNPDNPKRKGTFKAWYEKGQSQYKREEYKETIISLAKAIEINPFYIEPYNTAFMACLKLNDYNKAIEVLERFVEMKETNWDPYSYKKEYKFFAQNIERSLYISLGQLYVRNSEYEKAISLYKNYLWCNSKDKIVRLFLANIYLLGNLHEELIQFCQNTINLLPKLREMKIFLAEAYKQTNNLEKATQICIGMLKSKKKSSKVYYYLSCLYGGQMEYDKALKAIDAAISRDPNFYEALNYKGVIFTKKKEYDYALVLFDLVKQRCLEDSVYQYNYALLNMKLGNFKEALNTSDICLALNPQNDNAIKLQIYLKNKLSGIDDENFAAYFIYYNPINLFFSDILDKHYNIIIKELG